MLACCFWSTQSVRPRPCYAPRSLSLLLSHLSVITNQLLLSCVPVLIRTLYQKLRAMHLGFAAAALPDPATSWIPRGFLLAMLLWALNRNIAPPLGWETFRQASVPGGEVEILGIGRHSATVVFVQ